MNMSPFRPFPSHSEKISDSGIFRSIKTFVGGVFPEAIETDEDSSVNPATKEMGGPYEILKSNVLANSKVSEQANQTTAHQWRSVGLTARCRSSMLNRSRSNQEDHLLCRQLP